MDFLMKLPRTKKEFAIFIAIVSVISVNIIAPLITCFEAGFSFSVWADVLTVLPFLWFCVVVLVLATYKPAEWMTGKIIAKTDSFHAHIIINTLCTVFMMSIFLTVIGTWIGTRQVSLEPIYMFFYKWPRNFAVSFAAEVCIAQPAAHFCMVKLHQSADAKVS